MAGWDGVVGPGGEDTWLRVVVVLMVVSSLLMVMTSWSSPFGLWLAKWSAIAGGKMRMR